MRFFEDLDRDFQAITRELAKNHNPGGVVVIFDRRIQREFWRKKK